VLPVSQIEFTRRIDLGHIVQAVVMVVTMGAGLGGVVFTVESQISTQAVQYAALARQVLDQGAAIRQLQAAEQHSEDGIQLTLSKLTDELTQLRIAVGPRVHIP